MKRTLMTVLIFSAWLAGCSMLSSFALDALSPNKGGINTEIVVGDKEQVLGTNQEVKANTIEKVIGTSDNSVAVQAAEEIQINNTNIPMWFVAALLVLAILGWVLPTPMTMFNRFTNRNTK